MIEAELIGPALQQAGRHVAAAFDHLRGGAGHRAAAHVHRACPAMTIAGRDQCGVGLDIAKLL
jgi:hypothetical protein